MSKRMTKPETKTVEKKVVDAPKESTIYIGRSLPGLSRYTVFKGGQLPPHVAELADKNKSVAGLIVPVSGLQEARKNMQIKGHILNVYLTQQNKEA